jgi:hypothetical protein
MFTAADLLLLEHDMNMHLFMAGPPLISLLSGIAILLWPRLLNYIVAFYLILFGLAGLLPVLMAPSV